MSNKLMKNEKLILRGETSALNQLPYAIIGAEKFRDSKITWARYITTEEYLKLTDALN